VSRHGWRPPDRGEREPREPAELLEIQADDALLNEIAAGRRPGPPWVDSGFADERRMVGTLCAWRDEVWSEPIPDLVSVGEAVRAVRLGGPRPPRRLVPVAAAALVVLAGGGLLYGGSVARPGEPLRGVSSLLDGGRADGRVAVLADAVLAAARQALAQGRVSEARRMLDRSVSLVDGVGDPRRRDELTRMRANLAQAAREGRDGRPVHTDEREIGRAHV